MTIGITLLCRYNSKRLPGKILCDIQGRPLISHIIKRIQKAAPLRPLVVATSTDDTDIPIVTYCRRAGIDCFRGELDDVAGRFLACMETHEWDFGARINGDRLFLDIQTFHAMLAIADTNQFDLVTNVPGQTFPHGMAVEIVRKSFYRNVIGEMTKSSHREHVTSWLYENPSRGVRYVYENTICPEAAGFQLAIDTQRDLDLANKILEQADAAPESLGLQQVFRLATQQKLESPWNGKTGPFLIAEIGGNHEGNFEVAKAMCQLAIDSGTDCIKFQIYHGDTLVSPVESPDRHKHFQKFELTREQHVYLAEMCSEAGLVYCSSVWDLKILEWIDPYLSFYKIGSGDLTAWPILREFARRGKPILLSTGLATMEEVLQAVNQIQRIDERYKRPEMLCLMQCTSMYPIPDHDANLKVMNSFHSLTGLAVGYSDHTAGVTALRTAAAMGAQVLEFHFTDSRDGKIFRDHKVSLVADEVKQLKYEINEIIRLRGTDIKKPTQSETDAQHEISFRRAIYLSRAISDGQTITKDDLCLRRPLVGTDARDVALVIGAKALRDLKPMEAIRPGIDYSCPKDF